jgi:hypothetical protein
MGCDMGAFPLVCEQVAFGTAFGTAWVVWAPGVRASGVLNWPDLLLGSASLARWLDSGCQGLEECLQNDCLSMLFAHTAKCNPGVCEQVAFLSFEDGDTKGKVCEQGAADSILERPQHDEVKKYVRLSREMFKSGDPSCHLREEAAKANLPLGNI